MALKQPEAGPRSSGTPVVVLNQVIHIMFIYFESKCKVVNIGLATCSYKDR